MPLVDLLEKIWSRRFEGWKRYARSFTGDRAEADEVVQEALFKTLRAGPDLRDESQVHAYMSTAVRNVAIDHVRARLRSRAIDEKRLPDALVGDSTLELALRLEQRASERRLLDTLSGLMSELPPELRQVVELRVMKEPPLKLREVAEVQGVSTSTAHYRLERAIKVLADGIAELEEPKRE